MWMDLKNELSQIFIYYATLEKVNTARQITNTAVALSNIRHLAARYLPNTIYADPALHKR